MSLTKASFSMIDGVCINARDYGFLPSATGAQNKAAIQAAIAQLATNNRGGRIYLPQGFYLVDPDIDIGSYVVWFQGDGKYITQIQCNSAGSAMFKSADAVSPEYCRFSDFMIDGNYLLGEGIRMIKANGCTYQQLLITRTNVNGLNLGGYSNDVLENSIFTNAGSAIYYVGTSNNNNIINNRLYNNDGIGLIVGSTGAEAGLGFTVQGNNFEDNNVTGIFAFNVKALDIIGNYFERNASTGFTFGSPETITVATDIIIVGNNAQQIDDSDTFGTKQVIIDGNVITSRAYPPSASANAQAFVFSSYLNNVRISNNNILGPQYYDNLVYIYQNSDYSKIVGELNVSSNTKNSVSFFANVGFSTATQQPRQSHLVRINDADAISNFADNNLLSWTALSGTTGALVKSSDVFQKMDIWNVSDGNRVYGKTLSITNNPDLRGKWVWFGVWVNTNGELSNARLFLNGTSSSTATLYNNESTWAFVSTTYFIEGAETALVYGLQKIHSGATADLRISSPIIATLGSKFNSIPQIQDLYLNSAIPTTGAWSVNDVVYNSAPAAGQPQGWVCTVAGTPGTWKAMANLV